MKFKKSIILPVLLLAVLVSGLKANGHGGGSYEKASAANGGLLYDNFLKKGEVSARFSNIYNVNTQAMTKYANFFRCKQCHGWDRIGTKGYYGGRKPKAGKRPNVSNVDLLDGVREMSIHKLFHKIKKPAHGRTVNYDLSQYDPAINSQMGDAMPSYGDILSDQEIWDLVKFLKEVAHDYRNYYTMDIKGKYPEAHVIFKEIGKGGDALNGDAIYQNNCARCHGNDGTDIDIGDKSLGEFARTKTYELAHKVKFGQPGTAMTGTKLSVQELKDLHKALTDKFKYPNM